jgi:dihydropteroate synthase
MGVLNLTPDSFSDGGQFNERQPALEKCYQFVEDGVDIIDLGAESTRPGAPEVDEETEWQRLEPLLKELQSLRSQISISVDTKKPTIMRKAVELGVDYINDVSGYQDQVVLKELAQDKNLKYIAMHMHQSPQTMQAAPLDGEQAVHAVREFFSNAREHLKIAGFSAKHIFLDPGIGFGKTDQANAQLMAKTGEWSQSSQLLLGVSRKSFMGRTLQIVVPHKRDDASKMLEFGLVMMGAQIIRTHDVKRIKDLVKLL